MNTPVNDFITISQAADQLRRRELSSVELTSSVLDRIQRLDSRLNAFVSVTADLALLRARKADERLAAQDSTPLTGIPMAIKDIVSTEGVRTTCGSRILENYIPQYSATAFRRLEEAGAVLVGKTNMDEFAMGSSTENSAFHPSRNPWDLSRVPGGSSGGSAVAVASGLCLFALGTDTGGSIRQPAALTGTIGLKPTYGRVSRFGLVAFASSLDQIGPIARTVRDAASVLQVIAGHDPRDSTSLDAPVPDYCAALTGDLAGVRLGVVREWMGEGMSQGVRAAIDKALEILRTLGAELCDVSLPHAEYALSTYYIIAPAEAMANLARYDGVRYGLSAEGEDIWEMFGRTREAGFGREVKRRILLGTYALSSGYYDAYYLKAQKVRTLVRRDFDRALRQVDGLVAPTTPTEAFAIGEKASDPLQMYLSDVYTVPANIAGIPAMSVPAGFAGHLPVGLQILTAPLQEKTMLRIADAFERATGFTQRHPQMETAA
jgi:aspartyl-tRNA(Asn)/glutamyl-tRNA(Gln) amidotransferase subunit A